MTKPLTLQDLPKGWEDGEPLGISGGQVYQVFQLLNPFTHRLKRTPMGTWSIEKTDLKRYVDEMERRYKHRTLT